MKNFKFYCSILLAKSLAWGLKITKLSGGTAIIGLITMKTNKNFLKDCNQFIKIKINVTGTNGKTTTSSLITHLISNAKYNVINNSKGANMPTGITNALATELNPLKIYDYSVIETDEAYLTEIYNHLEADYLLVTNLFNDQTDRFSDVEVTKKYIQNAIDKKKNLKLILNADDPVVASLNNNEKIYYGVENIYYANENLKKQLTNEEIHNCNCGKDLTYSKKFYAHQGHYNCSCGFERPNPKYNAEIILHKEFSEILLNNKKYHVPLVGLYNAYNALAAISLCLELNIENIEESIKTFKVASGRGEVKYLNNKKVMIQLIKNPAGTNEVLKTIDKDSNILIAINDNFADGRDISWIFDTNFELINDIKNNIIVSGTRARDVAVRLEHAGISHNKIVIIDDFIKAVHYINKNSNGNITILPSYTNLLLLDKIKCLKNKNI